MYIMYIYRILISDRYVDLPCISLKLPLKLVGTLQSTAIVKNKLDQELEM